MEDPFFMHSWTPGRRSYFPHSYSRPQPKPSPPSKPKVVSIPVHFVASDNGHVRKPVARPTEADMSASAVKIQKAARGFLVRKNLRTVRKIAAEAEELARRIEAEEEAIRRDARERLRIGEMLMALLLRLDSVRGVRDCRKKVIRRVIQLQEAVDSIVATAETTQDRTPIDPEPMELPRSKMDDPDQTEGREEGEENSAADPMKETPPESCNTMDEVQETEANDEEAISTEGVHGRSTECKDVMRESAVEAVRGGDGSADEDLMQETMEIQMSMEDPIESMADSMEGAPESQVTRSAEECTVEVATKGEAGDQMQEMLLTGGRAAAAAESPGRKQMMENEQLKDMVAELCRRSEQQCLLMTGLVQRVEHLERAVQRMERKKKRHASSSLDKKCNQKKQ